MEDNLNVTDNNTQTQATAEPDAQGAAPAGEQKLFTQEEVNGVVQSRIARLKSQIEKESKAEYEQKLAEIQDRELKLLAKEKLDEKGMSRDLADIIAYTDEEDLNEKLDKLSEIYGKAVAEREPMSGFRDAQGNPLPQKGLKVGIMPTQQKSGIHSYVDPVKRAMGLIRKE